MAKTLEVCDDDVLSAHDRYLACINRQDGSETSKNGEEVELNFLE